MSVRVGHGRRARSGDALNGRRPRMIRHRFAVLAALACVSAGARPLAAQQPTARQVDSLAAEIRALKVRLDSVRAALAGAGRQARGAAPAKDTAAADELAPRPRADRTSTR